MDTDDSTIDTKEQPKRPGRGGPLSQLTEEQSVTSGLPDETTETAERPGTSRPPSTGPDDYASGTPEHDDDREG